ncbi:MAG: GldG family protein [Oscillospiraceae bacterium]|nr:GldG family protein [Oscillospiraceae bacterium]
MKKPQFHTNGRSLKTTFQSRTFRVGGYSVAAAAIVLAIAIVINVLVGALPASWTQLDATSSQLFTISEQTENTLAGLEEDVTIYWIVRSGSEDDYVESLLNRYASMSSHVSVEKKDPDVYPTFLTAYGQTDEAEDNSLLVVLGDNYRYIDYYSIYVYDYTYYYYTGSYDVEFDGESVLTSAISYVSSGVTPKLYTLTGHGESSLSDDFSSAVSKENIEVEELSLLTEGSVPEDADALLVYAPTTDISEEEKDALLEYLQAGGNLILITQPLDDEELTNLEALMAEYGVTASEGIVLEGNSSYYAWGYPYYLLPEISSHTVTDPLIDSGYYVLLPLAQGLSVSDELPDGVSVTELLTTTDAAYSKIAGYAMTTTEKEDGDIDGPFALAVAITDTIDDDTESNILWVSSAYLLDDSANSSVSGGNQDLFLNALNWMCEQEDSISIHAKSLSTEYLTMSDSAGTMLCVLAIGLIPAVYLAIGIVIWVRRRHR